MRVASITLAVALFFLTSSHAADVKTLVAAQRQRIETADYRANGHLIRVDANGNRLSFPMSIKAHWFPGVLRVLLELGAVSKTSEDSFLSGHAPVHILFEMRPNGKSLVQIAHRGDVTAAILPFERWSEGPLGAGFSYEDFLEAQYFWAGQSVLNKARFRTRDCDVVKSAPGATDKTHYTEVTSWLDHDSGFPVYVEKTLKGGTVKEFTYFGLRQNGGVWSAHQVEAKIRGHAGSTLLIIDRGTPKASLSVKDFSPAQLTHF